MFNETIQSILLGIAKYPSALSGISANIVAIPFSKIFIETANDTPPNMDKVSAHIRRTFLPNNSVSYRVYYSLMYKGGVARTMQKTLTATANQYAPTEYMHPILASALTGFFISPFSNVFKMLQINKVENNTRYMQSLKELATKAGFSRYLANTTAFMAQETLRCAACLLNLIEFLRENRMLNPRFLSRCFGLLLLKNLLANIPLTLGDEVARQHRFFKSQHSDLNFTNSNRPPTTP